MKVSIELNIELKMGEANLTGTGLAGYLPDGTTYKQLVKVFGKPQRDASPDGKIQVEWTGRINGLDFSIYDYKSDVKPQANTDWHIGGRNAMAASLVIAYFQGQK